MISTFTTHTHTHIYIYIVFRCIPEKCSQNKKNSTTLGDLQLRLYPHIYLFVPSKNVRKFLFLISSSSSSSCRTISTNSPDPLSSPLPIVHRYRQVLRATSCIYTELLYGRTAFVRPCEVVVALQLLKKKKSPT